MVQLDVDSEVNHVVGPLNPKATDHREPVFIGGVPGEYLAALFSNFNSFHRKHRSCRGTFHQGVY